MTEETLKKLNEDLNMLKNDYERERKNIALIHTKCFIEEVDNLLDVEKAESEEN